MIYIPQAANTNFGTFDHCVSLDFPATMLPQIVAGLPPPLGDKFTEALKRAPFQAAAGLVVELDISARLGELTKGRDEKFVPLVFGEILESRFNPDPVPDDPGDIPDHVFQLRKDFTIERGETDRS